MAAKAKPPVENLVVVLRGTALATPGEIPPVPGTGAREALRFELQMVDPSTGDVIGTATDYLADIEPFGDGSFVSTRTTFFWFRDGSIVSRGHTTVRPILSDGASSFTHMMSAVPPEGAGNILSGTGRYGNVKGRVCCSGAVNLSDVDDGLMTFDCIFTIEPA